MSSSVGDDVICFRGDVVPTATVQLALYGHWDRLPNVVRWEWVWRGHRREERRVLEDCCMA